MGGFKRVAAALELAYLPARPGRSQATAWSPEKAHPSLTLVQFSSSPRRRQGNRLSSDSGAPAVGAAGHDDSAAAGGEAAVQLCPAAPLTRQLSGRDAQQLASEQQARAGDSHRSITDSRVTSVDERTALQAAHHAVAGVRRSPAKSLHDRHEANTSAASRDCDLPLKLCTGLGPGGIPQCISRIYVVMLLWAALDDSLNSRLS